MYGTYGLGVIGSNGAGIFIYIYPNKTTIHVNISLRWCMGWGLAQGLVLHPLVFPNIAGWNITIVNRKYIFKGKQIHGYVSLPECSLGLLHSLN